MQERRCGTDAGPHRGHLAVTRLVTTRVTRERDTGSGQEDVETAEVGYGRPDGRFVVGLGGRIQVDEDRLVTVTPQIDGRRLSWIIEQVGDDYGGALFGEAGGTGQADTVRAAGDERDLSVQTTHSVPLQSAVSLSEQLAHSPIR